MKRLHWSETEKIIHREIVVTLVGIALIVGTCFIVGVFFP